MADWIPFTPDGPLPPERRYVLVKTAPTPEQPTGIIGVGWLRLFSYGPEFIVPGNATERTHWCDCLGDDFAPPGWSTHRQKKRQVEAE